MENLQWGGEFTLGGEFTVWDRELPVGWRIYCMVDNLQWGGEFTVWWRI